MINLLINIDHIATLRNARREDFPDPVEAAAACEKAGADGIVFHLREDRRHITDRDVFLLKEHVRSRLDFELSLNQEIVAICCDVVPDVATLVPERREEVTTEGGLDVTAKAVQLHSATAQLHAAGIETVSYFVDADLSQIRASADAGADCTELHTGDYANARSPAERQRILRAMIDAAVLANDLGLRVHAGHGFNYVNFPAFGNSVPALKEVSIGFAIIARAVFVGLEEAVRDMLDVVHSCTPPSHA